MTKQRDAAREFAEEWKDRGDEKGETQSFWFALLRDVFGVDQSEKWISFEGRVKVDKLNSPSSELQTNFIDARIPKTKVLIEQKSVDVDPCKPEKQSDGSFLTPFQQAKKYAAALPVSKHPRWIVVCNFREFRVHNMETPDAPPLVVKLENLPKEYHLLEFLVKEQDKALDRETQISVTAGEIVGRIYDAFLKEYKDPNSLASQRSLNILCVRLVFCLYAEIVRGSSGISSFPGNIRGPTKTGFVSATALTFGRCTWLCAFAHMYVPAHVRDAWFRVSACVPAYVVRRNEH